MADTSDASDEAIRPDTGPDAPPAAGTDEDWERPIDRFRKGAVGGVLAAGLLGIRDALEGPPEKDEPVIVADAPQPKLDHIDLLLDPEHPERSRAIVYLPPTDEAAN